MFRNLLLSTIMTVTAGLAGAKAGKGTTVADAAEQLRLAMISGDSVALRSLVLPQLSYGHSGGHIDNQDEFVQKIASGKSDFVTIDITDQTVTEVGDVAILRHKLHATTNDKGVPGVVDLLVMMVWHKEHRRWKLLARQAVKAK